MESSKFDVVARLFSGGQTRRDALRGMVAGTVAVVAGATVIDDASAKRKRRRRKKKHVCKKAGAFCHSNKQCCPGRTHRLCEVAVNAGNSDRTCCGGQGAKCGGADENLDDIGPFCCAGYECSSETSVPGVCQRVPEEL